MIIDKNLLDQIKASNPLEEIISSRGIHLKKVGNNLVGLRPFHNDTKPSLSVNPKKQLWNCFGCNGDGSSGGDVIKFIMKFDKIPFKQALEKLGVSISDLESKIQTPEDEQQIPQRVLSS